jgi:hypothetical protein
MIKYFVIPQFFYCSNLNSEIRHLFIRAQLEKNLSIWLSFKNQLIDRSEYGWGTVDQKAIKIW